MNRVVIKQGEVWNWRSLPNSENFQLPKLGLNKKMARNTKFLAEKLDRIKSRTHLCTLHKWKSTEERTNRWLKSPSSHANYTEKNWNCSYTICIEDCRSKRRAGLTNPKICLESAWKGMCDVWGACSWAPLCEAGRIWLHHSFDFSSILDDVHQDLPIKGKELREYY